MSESNTDQVHDYDADLTPQEFRFRLNSKSYVLREAPADAGRRWRNANTAGASVNKDTGQVFIAPAMSDSESILVQGSIREEFGDPKREREVSLSDVRSWPDRVVRDLFDRVKKMSGMDAKKEGEEDTTAKKPLSATKSTSE